ncbi:hypothetical protein [Blastopirellula marina]|uniref:Uncharacterized protein n=1 Tax=Blastopirellula marina TaxID=124 RepID=A0A2S8GR71_9BACT|nr:hypothetical protein [Blastopirellula marina]PQO46923.1 hypothetical protein C5Y93_07155 [Blastopirellula marina]
MAPHLRVYFGPEDETTPDDSAQLAEIVLGEASRGPAEAASALSEKTHPEGGVDQPAAAEIAVGLEELVQLIEDARRCGVALQDEIQGESVLVSRDLFRSLLAYQTLLQPQASLQ